jgi:hypothetical protein
MGRDVVGAANDLPLFHRHIGVAGALIAQDRSELRPDSFFQQHGQYIRRRASLMAFFKKSKRKRERTNFLTTDSCRAPVQRSPSEEKRFTVLATRFHLVQSRMHRIFVNNLVSMELS